MITTLANVEVVRAESSTGHLTKGIAGLIASMKVRLRDHFAL
jgi:hypothetical protein